MSYYYVRARADGRTRELFLRPRGVPDPFGAPVERHDKDVGFIGSTVYGLKNRFFVRPGDPRPPGARGVGTRLNLVKRQTGDRKPTYVNPGWSKGVRFGRAGPAVPEARGPERFYLSLNPAGP